MRSHGLHLTWLAVAIGGPLALVAVAQLETGAAMLDLLGEAPLDAPWSLGVCDAALCLRAANAGLVAWLRPDTPFALLGCGAAGLAAMALAVPRARPVAILVVAVLGLGLLGFGSGRSSSELASRPVMAGPRQIMIHARARTPPVVRPAVLGLVNVRLEPNSGGEAPTDPVLGWDGATRVVAERTALRWALLLHGLLCAAALWWLARRRPQHKAAADHRPEGQP
ncbi:MAG: hypothetical protein H6702_05865 [Myxococcales bacterium]|nr:hypothetical protein [Myxococcales bacterium]